MILCRQAQSLAHRHYINLEIKLLGEVKCAISFSRTDVENILAHRIKKIKLFCFEAKHKGSGAVLRPQIQTTYSNNCATGQANPSTTSSPINVSPQVSNVKSVSER